MNIVETILMLGCGLLFILTLVLLDPVIAGIEPLSIAFVILGLLFIFTTGLVFFRLAWRLILRGR